MNLGKTASETGKMLDIAHQEAGLSSFHVFRWHKTVIIETKHSRFNSALWVTQNVIKLVGILFKTY